MQNFAQLVPLVVFAPLIGLIINLLLGRYLGERGVGLVAVGAALTALGVAILQWFMLTRTGYQPVVVELPLLTDWINIPAAAVDITWQFRVDSLSVIMMLVVSGVGSLIHIYATGYMHGDAMYPRFFVYLNLFLVFMMLLVTGNNFLVLFVGWEGVGLCSYLLIGFWWDKRNRPADPAEAEQYGTEGWRNSIAARKAFIVNRVGDFGLLLAIFLIFWTFGTLDFYKPRETPIMPAHEYEAEAETDIGFAIEGEDGHSEEAAHSARLLIGQQAALELRAAGSSLGPYMGVFNQAELLIEEGGEVDFGPFSLPIETVLIVITLLFLLGVTGKSAQIPLFVWLPDAMAGPTPVSALIHAATMVTAGVYLIVRANVFYHHAAFASAVVALVGTATALVGGFIALGQWDIKKVLAYSTVSQLGFMVAAAGIGAYGAAMFHLVTHAFFKALLFLGSGSIIHAMEHGHHHAHEHAHEGDHDEEHGAADEQPFDPQDMRNMGGLRRTMPGTFRAYLIGTLALAGIFPLAGFWSKDEILADALAAGFLDGKLEGYIAFVLLFVAALFTAFYMGRQLWMVFYGEPRTEAAKYTGERAYGMPTMTRVLTALALGVIVIGFINVPSGFWIFDWIFPEHAFTSLLEHAVPYAHAGSAQMLLAFGAVLAGLAAIFFARSIYGPRPVVDGDKDPLETDMQTAGIFALANAKLYWDEIYDRAFVRPYRMLARFMADVIDMDFLHDFVHESVIYRAYNSLTRVLTTPIDLGLIDGAVNLTGRVIQNVAGRLRRVQTGYVRIYALSVFLGALAVVMLLIWPLLRAALGI